MKMLCRLLVLLIVKCRTNLLKLLSKDAPAALKLAQEELDKGASSKNILDE